MSYKTPFTAFVERLGRKRMRCLRVCEFVQPACSPWENIARYWGWVRTGYWGEYSDLREMKWQEELRKLYIEKLHNVCFLTTLIVWFFTSVFQRTWCSTEGRVTGEWWIVRALEGSDCSSIEALTKNLRWHW